MRRTRVHLLDGKAHVRCVVEILIFIVHWYVTSKALVSGILSLAVPNLEGKVQGPIDRVCKINSHTVSGKISIVERFSKLVCFIRNKPIGAISSREDLVLV